MFYPRPKLLPRNNTSELEEMRKKEMEALVGIQAYFSRECLESCIELSILLRILYRTPEFCAHCPDDAT